MSGGGDAEPTATKVQQSSWIQLDSIVIAALVFGIGLVVVVVVVNLLLEASRSDIRLYHTHPNQELVLYSSRRDRTISRITVQELSVQSPIYNTVKPRSPIERYPLAFRGVQVCNMCTYLLVERVK